MTVLNGLLAKTKELLIKKSYHKNTNQMKKKTLQKSSLSKGRKSYTKPMVEQIKIDKNISMVMMSTPPGDPTGMIGSIGSVFK